MEHKGCHLQRPHEHVPLDELDPEDFVRRRAFPAGMDFYILCRSGARARAAAEKFAAAGYPNVHVIEGGIIACRGCGEPVAGGADTSAPRRLAFYLFAIISLLSLIPAFSGHPAVLAFPLLAGLGLAYGLHGRRTG